MLVFYSNCVVNVVNVYFWFYFVPRGVVVTTSSFLPTVCGHDVVILRLINFHTLLCQICFL